MSTTEGRRDRMTRLIKCLLKNPAGLETHEIAGKTRLLEEISLERLHIYLQNLEYSGTIEQIDLHWRIVPGAYIKNERQRKKVGDKGRKQEKKAEKP